MVLFVFIEFVVLQTKPEGSNESSQRDSVMVLFVFLEFVVLQTKPEGSNESSQRDSVMVLFVLLLKGVHFLTNET